VNDADGILADVTPVEEEDLGAVNNKVAEGLHYPAVEQF
jgi:hypothetical protein